MLRQENLEELWEKARNSRIDPSNKQQMNDLRESIKELVSSKICENLMDIMKGAFLKMNTHTSESKEEIGSYDEDGIDEDEEEDGRDEDDEEDGRDEDDDGDDEIGKKNYNIYYPRSRAINVIGDKGSIEATKEIKTTGETGSTGAEFLKGAIGDMGPTTKNKIFKDISTDYMYKKKIESEVYNKTFGRKMREITMKKQIEYIKKTIMEVCEEEDGESYIGINYKNQESFNKELAELLEKEGITMTYNEEYIKVFW